jgi:hypothetical protein
VERGGRICIDIHPVVCTSVTQLLQLRDLHLLLPHEPVQHIGVLRYGCAKQGSRRELSLPGTLLHDAECGSPHLLHRGHLLRLPSVQGIQGSELR